MRSSYFADSWFFIAFIDRRDTHHRRARHLRFRLEDALVLTHESVLTEVLAFFSDEDPRLRVEAARFVRRFIDYFEVHSIDRPLFLRALDLYEQRPDKEYSLVDCLSMTIMADRGIVHVLTNDHHFTQAGFIIVNE